MRPRVSIGLPVRNGEPFLADTLGSLLAQDFADFELIVGDNASDDGTEEICRQAARGDARIRYHRWPANLGAAPNYNRVFELAQGEYFRWAAADDLYAPSHLRRCVETLDAAPDEAVLVYPRTNLLVGPDPEPRPYDDDLDLRDADPGRRFRALLERLHLCNAVFGLIRRAALARTRLIGSYVASDTVLLAELALLGPFHEIPERLFLRRIHPGGSQYANRSSEEVATWFDAGNRRGHVNPRLRLVREHLAAIRRAPVPLGAKARCASALLALWLPRYWRVMGGEVKRDLRWRLLG